MSEEKFTPQEICEDALLNWDEEDNKLLEEFRKSHNESEELNSLVEEEKPWLKDWRRPLCWLGDPKYKHWLPFLFNINEPLKKMTLEIELKFEKKKELHDYLRGCLKAFYRNLKSLESLAQLDEVMNHNRRNAKPYYEPEGDHPVVMSNNVRKKVK